MSETVGRVSAVWRFPVKSMQGESLLEADVTTGGVLGDRAYALIDVETGKVVSAKSAKLYPDMFGFRARFVAQPAVGADKPAVVVTLPDGTRVTSEDTNHDEILSRFFGRKVRLSSVAPKDFTIDQYHPDIADEDPYGRRDTVVATKLGSASYAQAGIPSPVPAGAFFDLYPVSVMTTSTLRTFSEQTPGSRFDERRFRMNLIVDTEPPGFVENEWVGHVVSIEDGPRLRVAMPDPRCVMPMLAQGEELPRDADVLHTLIKNNRVELDDGKRYPCAGVYAEVESPGQVRVGAGVTLT